MKESDHDGLGLESQTKSYSLHSIFGYLESPLLHLTDGLEINYANKPAQELFGKANGYSLSSICPVLENVAKTATASKSCKTLLYRYQGQAGKKTFRVMFNPVYSQEHAKNEILALFFDMSDLDSEKVRLLNDKARLDAQTRALNVFDIVDETDTRGRIFSVNDQFLKVSKYKREDLLGRDHRILNSGCHPKSFFRKLWQTVGRGQVWSGEICNRAKDGSHFWVQTVITPVFDETGRLKKFLAVRKDITRQKEMELKLRSSQERYRQLLEHMGRIAVGLDLNGFITFVNASFLNLTGWSRDEIIGQDWFAKCVLAQQQESSLDCYNDLIATEKPVKRIETELVTKHGKNRVVAWTITLFRDSQGNLKGTTFFGEDITERKRQHQKLKELRQENEAQRKEMISFIAHELRNPLMTVRAGLELINMDFRDGKLDASRLHSLTESLNAKVDQIDRVSREFFDSYVDSKTSWQIKVRPVHLNRLLQDVCKKFAADINGRADLELKLTLPDAEVIGQWDPERLDQVFSNLINNAIKYSKPTGGVIHVEAKCLAHSVLIMVRDSGIGIPSDELNIIFQPHHRCSNAVHSGVAGDGLGLKIVRDIINLHSGKLQVDSKLNEGSEFFVYLPFSRPKFLNRIEFKPNLNPGQSLRDGSD